MNINLSIYYDVVSLLHNLDFDPNSLALFFLSIFLLILFAQSGIDKVLDFGGNLQFLTVHFKKTIFKKMVLFLLISLTILELITACVFFVGLVSFFILADFPVDFLKLGIVLSAITICCLFLGQRIAKDYVGAATLTFYFVLTLLGFFFF